MRIPTALTILLALFAEGRLTYAQSLQLEWTQEREVEDLSELKKSIGAAAAEDTDFRLNATVLGFKAAAFLSSGSLETPRIGTIHRLSTTFKGGKEAGELGQATVSVQFLGLSNRGNRFGERYEIELSSGVGKKWKVKSARIATCRQKPFQLRAPESGKFREFLEAARIKAEGGPVKFRHKDWKGALAIRIYDESALDPIDPMIIRLKGKGIYNDDVHIPLEPAAAKISEFKSMCELINEEPVFILKVAEDVAFDDGLRVLRTIVEAGIEEIALPADRIPHGSKLDPVGSRTTEKPIPPSELFQKK